MLIKIVLIAAFAALTVFVGYTSRKSSSSVNDFVLGGRKLGPWVTAFAYGTSYFSSVVFIGYAGQFGYNFGIAATWIGLGNAFLGSLLPWVILGRRTRIMTKHFEAATMPEYFAKRYDSPALKTISSVIIFVFLVPYSASVYKGLSELFAMAFNIDFTWCVLGIALITAVYVIFGGYRAAALNDFIQGIIMLGGITLVVVSVLNGKGGFTEAISQLSKVECEAMPGMNGAYTSFFGPAPLALLSVVVLTSMGSWGLPQMVHKFYTIKNEESIKSGAVISTVFALVIAGGSYFMGAFGRLYYDKTPVVFDEIVPVMLASNLSDILIGVVLILVLSASMSTLSSLVITSSSTFTLDFIASFTKKKPEPKKQLTAIKLLCAFFVALSAAIALNPTNLISSLMSLSWGALAGAFLGPFMYGLFFKNITKAAVFTSFICGIAITVGNLFIGFTTPTGAGALAIVASLIVTPLVSLITPKYDKAFTERVFSCYEKKAVMKQVYVLTEEYTDTERAVPLPYSQEY